MSQLAMEAIDIAVEMLWKLFVSPAMPFQGRHGGPCVQQACGRKIVCFTFSPSLSLYLF